MSLVKQCLMGAGLGIISCASVQITSAPRVIASWVYCANKKVSLCGWDQLKDSPAALFSRRKEREWG